MKVYVLTRNLGNKIAGIYSSKEIAERMQTKFMEMNANESSSFVFAYSISEHKMFGEEIFDVKNINANVVNAIRNFD